MAKGCEIHVLSNTHWDREWVHSYQSKRILLVEMMDQLLEILDYDPDYKYYHLDAQTIPLEDYLEIRPENRERLKKHIQSGRLLIGPWYVLPDEFLVSGESLVRNLLRGHKVARQFGPVMKVGYTPCSWGQVSQLPQIYAGFGIDTVLFYRGINRVVAPKSEFVWEGADGTRALASRFTVWPRYNFWYLIYRPVAFGLFPTDRAYDWKRHDLPFRMCDEFSYQESYKLLNPSQKPHWELLHDCVQQTKEDHLKDANTNVLLWMQGHDSSGPIPLTPKIIEQANKLFPEDRMIHSSFPAYIERLKEELKEEDLTVLKGEMRYVNVDGRAVDLFGYVLSARMYLKQLNTAVENKLQRWTDPFASFCWALREEHPTALLDRAWRYLLTNHGHDSIGGCSVDTVHKDMLYRFRQCEEISETVLQKSFQKIVRQIDNSDEGKDALFLVVFNPLSAERTEVVKAVLDLPGEIGAESLALLDADGKEMDIQIASKERTVALVEQLVDVPLSMWVDRFTLYFTAEAIPSFGYKTFRILSKKTTKRNVGSLITAVNTMENEYLLVRVNANGTLQVTDKSTGRVYDRLGYFEDEGEGGNAWLHILPEGDRGINTLRADPSISIEEDGPLSATLRIEFALRLPIGLNDSRKSRSEEQVDCQVISLVTLRNGARRVDIKTRINNQARDHRLRVIFPTGLVNATTSCAEGQFDVVERPIARPDTSDWVEQPMFDYPQRSFVDVSDGEYGLAILNKGLSEYEVREDKDCSIALTLMRCFRFQLCMRNVGGRWLDWENQPDSQMQGWHEFEYAIYPHRGRWTDSDVFAQAHGFNLPMRMAQCGQHQGALPKALSFLTIEPKTLVPSGIKLSESGNAIIVRVFNPTSEKVKGTIKFFRSLRSVRLVRLDEQPVEELEVKEGSVVEIEAGPKQIVTVEITPQRQIGD